MFLLLLFADSNGSFKELVFPKALDLDRPKRARTTFSPEQLYHLEREFQRNQYMIGKDRSQLAQELGLSETQVILIKDYILWNKQYIRVETNINNGLYSLEQAVHQCGVYQ